MDADANSQAPPPAYKLRWYQYSLRSLLLLTLLCAILCSWLAVKINQGKRQKAAVDALKAKGFQISYDYEVDRDGNPRPNGALNVPKWLRYCLGDDCFATVVGVQAPFGFTFGGIGGFHTVCGVTDDDLRPLTDLPHVKFLSLSGGQISDSALRRMRNLSELEHLRLNSTKITDAGLVELKAFPNLRVLDLDDTNVTDAGMADVVRLNRLEELDLAQTRVTDRCLTMLQNLKALKHLSFMAPWGTLVTREGVAKFKQAMPNCEVAL